MTRLPLMRTRLIRFGVGAAATLSVAGAAFGPSVLAQTLPLPMPAQAPGTSSSTAQAQLTIGQTLPFTLAVTEGPYFKANSPETTNVVQDGMQGTVITITGQVLDQNGNPVANALLDFWQANASGQYDNVGYTLRGHQYADENGYYTLTTIVPGLYPGRTEHIHVKVQAPGSSVLTTQLFFPGLAQNARDSIYDPSLLLNVTNNADGTESATFNFVVPTA
jgi:protocatechuate 3,4-dioxygenase beta subunit